MTKLCILLAVTTLGVANLAAQQMPTTEQQIAAATLPLPEAYRAGATVESISTDLNATELRKGANSMVCSITRPGSENFHAACFEKGYAALLFRQFNCSRNSAKTASRRTGRQSMRLSKRRSNRAASRLPLGPQSGSR